MAVYEGLSRAAQLYRERQLAEAVLARYHLDNPHLTLLTYNFNTVYRVDGTQGRYIMRIQEPYTLDAPLINSELAWLKALRHEAGLSVPEPVADETGVMVTTMQPEGIPPRHVVLFRWMDGQLVGGSASPTKLRKLGAIMAKMHHFTRTWQPPADFTRLRWDWQRLFGAASVFASGKILPYLDDELRAIYDAAATRLSEAMGELGETPDNFGLIHNDMHASNYLYHQGEIKVIDFEVCGWGHWLLDMAVTLEDLEGPRKEAMREAFLEGYSAIKPLPPGFAKFECAFIMARLMEMATWVVETNGEQYKEAAPRIIRRLANNMREIMMKD